MTCTWEACTCFLEHQHPRSTRLGACIYEQARRQEDVFRSCVFYIHAASLDEPSPFCSVDVSSFAATERKQPLLRTQQNLSTICNLLYIILGKRRAKFYNAYPTKSFLFSSTPSFPPTGPISCPRTFRLRTLICLPPQLLEIAPLSTLIPLLNLQT